MIVSYLSDNRLFSYSEKEYGAKGYVHHYDRSSNATQLNLAYKNV